MDQNFLALIIIVPLAVVLGVIIGKGFIGSAWELALLYILKRTGVSTDAEITTQFSRHEGRGTAYYIIYAFLYGSENERYERQQQVHYRHYRRWAIGSSVRVMFPANKPQWSRLSEDYLHQLGSSVVVMIVVTAAGFYWNIAGILIVAVAWLILFGVSLVFLRTGL